MNVQALPMHRFIDHHGGDLVGQLPNWADTETLVGFYRDMVLTRTYDNKAVALQRTGKLGTYPSHLGAEAIGIAVGRALKADDVFVPYYRDMPAMWCRGIGMEKNLQYWGGDERGSDFAPEGSPIPSEIFHSVSPPLRRNVRTLSGWLPH